MDGMSCRLLLLDRAGVHAAADRSGPRDGSMLLLAGATARDRDEANRISFCTKAVADAVERIETVEPRSRVRFAYGPRPSPVPGDIRTFELNVQIVLEHVDRVRNAEQASRLQRRIREIAMHWASGLPDRDEESALLEEIYNADAEITRLAGVAAPWLLAGQRRALAGEQSRGRERSRSRTEGGQAAVAGALRLAREQSRRRERAMAEGGQAAVAEALRQRAAQSDAAQRYGEYAAVAAFDVVRERDAQMRERGERALPGESASSSTSPRVRERGRGRVIRPIVVNDSSEDGG